MKRRDFNSNYRTTSKLPNKILHTLPHNLYNTYQSANLHSFTHPKHSKRFFVRKKKCTERKLSTGFERLRERKERKELEEIKEQYKQILQELSEIKSLLKANSMQEYKRHESVVESPDLILETVDGVTEFLRFSNPTEEEKVGTKKLAAVKPGPPPVITMQEKALLRDLMKLHNNKRIETMFKEKIGRDISIRDLQKRGFLSKAGIKAKPHRKTYKALKLDSYQSSSRKLLGEEKNQKNEDGLSICQVEGISLINKQINEEGDKSVRLGLSSRKYSDPASDEQYRKMLATSLDEKPPCMFEKEKKASINSGNG
ncbi:unnamed protein product [Moneuplotes crassus]|uniref:Uncharacterized protein n=1 Tax=Euplotes crassus TaxID=5936 RepID=A0AAD1XYI6_EUPCR|nr:unnamed protein product [Moneuplotes crassus]